MNTIMAIAIGCSYSGRSDSDDIFDGTQSHSLWDLFNPRYYFRTVSWYLPFHDRVKAESNWSLPSYREKNPPSASYIRQMKDAGRGRLL